MNSKNTLNIVSFIWMFAAGALGGCVAVAAGHVQVLNAVPTVPYEVIGKVYFFQQDEVGFKAGVLNGDPLQGLREKAAALGADAVIVTSHQKSHPTEEHHGELGSRSGELVEGIAIHYKKAGEPTPGSGETAKG